MSGKPNPEGVKRYRWLRGQLEKDRTDLARLMVEADMLKQRITSLQGQVAGTDRDLRQLMEEMDLIPGNTGYRERLEAFLGMLHGQTEAELAEVQRALRL